MKNKLVYIFLLIVPFVDLITSITERYLNVPFSLGMIFKGIFILFLLIYCAFFTKSKYKRIIANYLVLSVIFVSLYFIFKQSIITEGYLFRELLYLIKLFFLPVSFLSLMCFFDDFGFQKEKIIKLLLFTIVIYASLLIIPIITKTSFNTYQNGMYGMVGWFYAANEISIILVLLFPFLYKLINKKYKYLIIGILPIILVISYVGTKVTLFGLIIVSFIVLIFSFFHNNRLNKNPFISCLLIFITVLIICSSSVTIKNVFTVIENPSITENPHECHNCENLPGDNILIKIKKYGMKLLSQRNYYLYNTNNIYINNFNFRTFLFGLGFSNTSNIDNPNIEKLIEMDMPDIFYHYGIIGLLLFLLPFLLITFKIINNKGISKNCLFYILMLLMSFGISTFAGHVFIAPSVSIYIGIYLLLVANELDMFNKKLNKNKISILALHMGFGGVENAIASTASMLCEKYNVEIISLYKKVEKIPFEINSKVKVIYLMNETSNKEKITEAIKNKKVFLLLIESYKAVKILYLKHKLIKKYISDTDAKIIISTRYSFSKLLNKFGRKDCIKLAEEHTYTIDNKYIKKLNKLKNIDFLLPASKKLLDQYKNRVNIKLKYIPLTINYIPNKQAELKKANLIAIGRLEKVKGFIDLIDIVHLLVLKNKKIFLNIFGDGSEFDKIKEKITQLELNNNIKLWGYKDSKFIESYMIESSLYVMTSFEESFGLVILEANSYGIPAIAFSCAEGAKELITKDNGYIINKRSNNLMANTIIKYFELNLNERKKLGLNARNSATKYTKENVKEYWLKFIEEVLNEKNF
ncbi:MAG: O-antigen ligase family protein [Bacilli bacterium]